MLYVGDSMQPRKTAFIMPEGYGATMDLFAHEFVVTWRQKDEPKTSKDAGTYDCLTCLGMGTTMHALNTQDLQSSTQ